MATQIKPGADGAITITTENDPPSQPAAKPEPQERTFTADEIADARRQEKDKLYPRIETLEEQLRVFNQERDAAAEAAAQAQAAADAERRAREESEMSAKELLQRQEQEFNSRLEEVTGTLQSRLNELQQQSEAQQALLEQERRFQALNAYKNRRVQEEQDHLMPELLDFITGNTEDEIEASISTIAARTSAIVGNIQQSMAAQAPPRLRGIPPTGGSPTGPVENAQEQTLTPADIANLSMEQYAQLRGRLMEAASVQRRR
jgi:hypothetical protein